jgi:hypothetical protein
MGLPEFEITIATSIAAIALSWGYTMKQAAIPNLRAVKTLFWVSGVCFWSLGVIWAMNATDQPIRY